MCEFCKNIDEMHIIEDGYFQGKYLPEKNINQIVKDGDKFHIWSDADGDCFQSGICVEDIEYCPKCGRKLVEEKINQKEFTEEELWESLDNPDLRIELKNGHRYGAKVISVNGNPENCEMKLRVNFMEE